MLSLVFFQIIWNNSELFFELYMQEIWLVEFESSGFILWVSVLSAAEHKVSVFLFLIYFYSLLSFFKLKYLSSPFLWFTCDTHSTLDVLFCFVWHVYCSSLCMCRSRLYIEILFIIFAWCFMGPVCFVFVGRPFPSPVCSTSHASPVLHCWPRGKRTEKSAAQWTGVWVTQTQII